ncbi:hypothetical protein [Corallococcus macrosporus]|uniref:Uncharacterized protein n=1 Tax=Corallococcus macrosporus DSM 14697 TaxID=1189310 RepID=A0A250JLC3_9BACT|nr:hypothetical protein [Corallococcus macrosporus]ATB44684.1 hypothetical protein MYMAC_000255 [Corallococcus macrosporus DSM 14697]
MPPSQVEFIQYHQPALESGVYRIRVEQDVSTTSGKIPKTTYSREAAFAVVGERFTPLAAQDVAAVFPAEGSLGDHLNVLPHISFTRSTLPWERTADTHSRDAPWLVLLLLRDSDFASADEVPKLQTLTLGQLQGTPRFPKLELEPGQQDTDSVQVIDVKKRLLASLLPSKQGVKLLAHVRQPKDDQGHSVGPEVATLLCNRLPQNGGRSTAYLVSVEDRYARDGDGFDFQGAGDDEPIRLVCLKRWSFSCVGEQQSFTALLKHLDRTGGGTLRLPDSPSADANALLATGQVPLPHLMREGDRTVSWYHGPFRPGAPTDALTLPVHGADALVRYSRETGMFDTAYAAAWELGRMLTLRNTSVSLALFNWKRSRSQHQIQQAQAAQARHLPRLAKRVSTDMPGAVQTWFDGLARLEGIPFDYLVPDERMLPVESIRFFRVDPLWVQCLQDGAFSIGRVTDAHLEQDADNPAATPEKPLSGLLLRSAVVSGWQGLRVDAFSSVVDDIGADGPADKALTMLRMERLSPNVLLCLFDGVAETVDIHLKPETLHFGVDVPDQTPADSYKHLRSLSTGEELTDTLRVPWQAAELGVLDIQTLARAFQQKLGASTFTSAQFALEMMEGVQRVRFTCQTR